MSLHGWRDLAQGRERADLAWEKRIATAGMLIVVLLVAIGSGVTIILARLSAQSELISRTQDHVIQCLNGIANAQTHHCPLSGTVTVTNTVLETKPSPILVPVVIPSPYVVSGVPAAPAAPAPRVTAAPPLTTSPTPSASPTPASPMPACANLLIALLCPPAPRR